MTRLKLKYEQRARQRTKDFIRTVITILGCQVCGERDFSCIDLHHNNPDGKEADVSKMISNKWSYSKIKQEMVKCVPLCANCHRKFHKGRLQTKTPLSPIDESFLDGAEIITRNIPLDDLIKMFEKEKGKE